VSPVTVMLCTARMSIPSSTGPEKSRVNLSGPPDKPKYSLMTDSGPVP
jgi:hypothetical protein